MTMLSALNQFGLMVVRPFLVLFACIHQLLANGFPSPFTTCIMNLVGLMSRLNRAEATLVRFYTIVTVASTAESYQSLYIHVLTPTRSKQPS